MRRLLVSGLFLGLLVSCGTNAPESTELSKPDRNNSTSEQTTTPIKIASPNPFARVSFPQDSCGDSLPDDVSDYPIQFYPVYINYRERDLQALKTYFCRDALKKFRTKVGRDVIQVASFQSLERANSFKTLMEREFGNGEIGEATLIDSTQGTVSNNLPVPKAAPKSEESESKNFQYLAKQAANAKLTTEHIEQLTNLSKHNYKEIDFKIVIPTYIPSGFKVDSIDIKENDKGNNSLSYYITYRNFNGSCFSISGLDNGAGEGDPVSYYTIEVTSPALGQRSLIVTEYDDISNFSSISLFQMIRVNSKSVHSYGFSSGGSIDCLAMNVNEAVKVAESLNYMHF